MASPTLTELFDFTPYPRPKPGRELEAELATNGAAGLFELLAAIEFLCWEGGASDPAAKPAERLRQQHAAKFGAGYAARQGDEALRNFVVTRCPGFVDVLNVMAADWPASQETVANELIEPASGNTPTDAAAECAIVVIGELRARLTGDPLPRPRLPGAVTVLNMVNDLNVLEARRVVADTAALDGAAQRDTSRADIRARIGATAHLDDNMLREANGAALILLDFATAYARRRKDDADMEAVLKRLVKSVFKIAMPTIKKARARDFAELVIVVEAAYARVRTAPDDLAKVLREEATARFPNSAFVFQWLDEFVIPVGRHDPGIIPRADGEGVSIVELDGPKRAASTMVERVFGDEVTSATLELSAKRWQGATEMTAFGVAPRVRDRLRHMCRLVTTSEDNAELLFDAAVEAAKEGGWFVWREASPVRWG